jgi:Ni/Fe-hydrogenase subunit HybB-like protein
VRDPTRPLGGKIFTGPFLIMLAFAGVGAALVVFRLFEGVGAITAMTDGYPWGIWKPLNVVTFTGVAAGAYGVGLLTYILNRGQYHPLVRPAVLVGALGYTLAGLSVLVDLGRWWNAWKLGQWYHFNVNSVLLEVALCVLTYVAVLWVEVTPAILEHWHRSDSGKLKQIAVRGLPVVTRALPFVISLAILLPTMHQSSLGSMFLVAIYKLHPLWHTPLLPLLFLISCLIMGYGGVVIVDTILGVVYRHKRDTKLLANLSRVTVVLIAAYLVIRFGDLAWHHKLGYTLKGDMYGLFFWGEMALFAGAGALLSSHERRMNPGVLFWASILAVHAGALYRFSVYLIAYDPGPNYVYFPSVSEVLVSVGLAAAGIAAFTVLIKIFPILHASTSPEEIRKAA